MLYRTLEIDELIDLKDADRAVVDLMENENSTLKLIGLKKHQILEPHVSHSDVCLLVTEGEIEIKFNNEENMQCTTCSCNIDDEEGKKDEKKYKVKKGQMFFFAKNVMHSVEALKDSSFLAVTI